MATIQVQDIYKKDGNGIFYSLRGNYVKDANGVFQQIKPGDGIKGADGNWYVLSELIKYIRDPKDNRMYLVKRMPDGNWWTTTNYTFSGSGRTYNDDETHRAAYGGQYTMQEALANAWNGVALPTQAQWTALIQSMGGWGEATAIAIRSTLNSINDGANSPTNPTWLIGTSGPVGLDTYGFSALPGGEYYGSPSVALWAYRGDVCTFLADVPVADQMWCIFITKSDASYSSLYMNNTASVRYIVTDTSILI